MSSAVDNDEREITDDKENEELVAYLYNHMATYPDAGYYYPVEKCLLPAKFREIRQRIRNIKVHEDDTWVIVSPKSGTTWALEMVWLIANDMDYKKAEADILVRFPYIEVNMHAAEVQEAVVNLQNVIGDDPIDYVNNRMSRPRYIRSHLPLSLLPPQLLEKKPKVLTVLRDPRDIAVSYYHFLGITEGYTGTPEKCFEAFKKGLILYGDYWHHVAPFWKLRNEPNVLVLTYEEMKKDLAGVINRTSEFFGKNYTSDQVAQAVDHLSVAKMRENNAVNMKSKMEFMAGTSKEDAGEEPKQFIRKGIVGDHKNLMSEDVIKEFDSWIVEMKSKFGLSDDKDFPY